MNRPFPGPEFSTREQPRNHLLLVAAVNAVALAMIALLIYRVADASVPSLPAQSIVQIEVTRERVVTPTRTPTQASTPTAAVVVVTATATPTRSLPYCQEDAADAGEACWKLAEVPTPTTIPPCSAVRSNYGAVLCVKEDSETSGKESTG